MFARHTSTRMKGSSVVQGLKFLASRLHPQLPLNPKESQRLLTALTSSFRLQLDKAHPRQARDGVLTAKTEYAPSLKTERHGIHSSSVDLADKHLAFVLTSSLLMKGDAAKEPVLDYTSAKVKLQKDPAKDPIALLEEYHEQGAASIPIATLCLETLRRSLENVSPEARRKELMETEAGKRTLLWLWKSKLYESDLFVDDHKFRALLVPLVIEEGFEEYLWDWLKLDLVLGSQDDRSKTGRSKNAAIAYRYRWKGHLLRDIIEVKIATAPNRSTDAALDAFFRACNLKLQLAGDTVDPLLPLAAAGMVLEGLWLKPDKFDRLTDAARYNRFMGCNKLYVTIPELGELQRALLQLFHPHTPSPQPILGVLRKLFYSNPADYGATIRGRFETPRSEKQEEYFYQVMIETVRQLQAGMHTDDANWVLSRISELHPKRLRFVESDLGKRRRAPRHEAAGVDQRDSDAEVMPFPTFV